MFPNPGIGVVIKNKENPARNISQICAILGDKQMLDGDTLSYRTQNLTSHIIHMN